MNIAAVFIVYFGIKETQFHRDTGARRGQYLLVFSDIAIGSSVLVKRISMYESKSPLDDRILCPGV